MALIGYARVSTEDQNLARQLKDLEAYGCELTFKDKKSGKNFEREDYQKMKSKLREKDVLVVHDLSRFGRNAKEIRKEWEELRAENVDIVVLNMPILDTRNEKNIPGMGQMISEIVLTLLSWVVEDERKRSKEYQREGIEIAKQQGKYKGRATKYHEGATGADRVVYDEIVRLLNDNASVNDIHKRTGVARNTIYRIRRELNKRI